MLIDTDKENIMRYFELILPRVSIGRVIVTDNMPYPEKHEMKIFSDPLKTNTNVRTTTVPIGKEKKLQLK